ncbi:MAG TPA: GNAT family N-acetyltransferase [Candidatus Limnocylindrales bacterium]|nr:GNAT family N-acetyltransferase [Candidatus Limnocylindrales bacterium]
MAARREPIAPEELEIRPATADAWDDVVTLLGGSGERGCWCQAWRGADGAPGGSAFGRAAAGANRDALESQVRSGAFAPGVVAYLDGGPVGWCGLGPRAAMPRLVRSRTIPRVDDVAVWSIGCFVVRAGFRRRGVARALLDGAVAYARSMGAPAVEAYPIDPGTARVSTSFAFVGFTSTFEAAGFRRVVLTDARSAGLPRWLMRLDLA